MEPQIYNRSIRSIGDKLGLQLGLQLEPEVCLCGSKWDSFVGLRP